MFILSLYYVILHYELLHWYQNSLTSRALVQWTVQQKAKFKMSLIYDLISQTLHCLLCILFQQNIMPPLHVVIITNNTITIIIALYAILNFFSVISSIIPPQAITILIASP